MKKPQAQTHHALRRAYERYGKILSPMDLARIRKLIQGGRSRYEKKLSCSRSQHRVMYNGEVYRVVYDKSRKQICSFLPRP